MIIFRKISFKNFLSTGNTPTEIDFDSHNTTLIIGDNGSGKSTVLDALTFGLFGKPFRNIKKDQLVNTVNERDCRVEVHFDIGKRHYHILRCIKPNRFEIYQNGKMLNQDASIRDYQKHLESSILKLNFRSFTQVVILGSSSFIPFMQLTPAHRREVVEEILDIKIFYLMNLILKQKMKDMKDKETDIAHQFNLTETKITMAEDHISQTKEKSKTSKAALQKKIKDNEKDILELKEQAGQLSYEVDDWRDNVLPKQFEFKKEQTDFINVRVKLHDNSNRMEKEIKLFKEHDDCPTCEQSIGYEFKEKAIERRTDKMITNACALTRMDEQIKEMDAQEERYNKIAEDTRNKEVEAAKKTTSANSILSFNEQLTDQITDLLSIDADLVEEKTKLKLYRDELKTIEKHKNKLTED